MDCGNALVADEDGQFRKFVSRRLSRAGYTVDTAATGEEALAAVARRRPDVVVLEVELPETSGYQVCHELKEAYGDDITIIFVSAERTKALDRVGGLLIGADDYLVKPLDADELIARVRRFPARRPSAPRRGAGQNGYYGLTRREREVLALLAQGSSQDQIARALVLSPKTVATHIQHILAKLGVHSRVEAVALAHQDGLTDPRLAGPRGRSTAGASVD
jgi:DNA-binding NarL/FixJ family response regulator